MSLTNKHLGGVYMNMREMAFSFKANGFVQNPHTHKWVKQGVNAKNGELPTTHMSEQSYWHSGVYTRKARED